MREVALYRLVRLEAVALVIGRVGAFREQERAFAPILAQVAGFAFSGWTDFTVVSRAFDQRLVLIPMIEQVMEETEQSPTGVAAQ